MTKPDLPPRSRNGCMKSISHSMGIQKLAFIKVLFHYWILNLRAFWAQIYIPVVPFILDFPQNAHFIHDNMTAMIWPIIH